MGGRLSRLLKNGTTDVNIVSDGGNTLDTVVDSLTEAVKELKLTRIGHEEWNWGDYVKESRDTKPRVEDEINE